MKIKETIVINRLSPIYKYIHKAFMTSREADVWYRTKKREERLIQHSNKLFRHAHWMIARSLRAEDIKWSSWTITIGERCTLGDWYSEKVVFYVERKYD